MKLIKRFNSIRTAFVSIGTIGLMLLSGCEKESNDPVVTIDFNEKVVVTENSIEITIIPSDDVKNFKYAITATEDQKAFEDGTMEGIAKVDGNKELVKKFENLTPNTEYTVYAQGFNGNIMSVVKSKKITTAEEEVGDATIKIEQNITVSENAVTFTLTPGEYAASVRYAVASLNEKEAFEGNTLNGSVNVDVGPDVNGNTAKAYTVDGLDPKTNYAVFAIALNKAGEASDTAVMEFVTESDVAEVNVVFDKATAASLLVTTTPNSKCEKYISYVILSVNWDRWVNSWGDGDEATLLENMLDDEDALLHDKQDTSRWKLGNELDTEFCYAVLIYDNDGSKRVEKHYFTTPSFTDNVEKALMKTLEITEINETSVKILLEMNDDVICYYYGIAESSKYLDTRDASLGSFIKYAILHVSDMTVERTGLKPDTEYTVWAVSCNVNGDKGLSDYQDVTFTTKAKE